MSYKYTSRGCKTTDTIFGIQENTTEPRTCYTKRARLIQLVLVGTVMIAVGVGLTVHLIRKRFAFQPRLLIVSFDGFRWDYPDLYRPDMPFFNRFAQEGVRANRGIQPCFSTETFPNHFSIATGLFEESHGIVSNSVFNPVLNKSFSFNDPMWFQNGDPIWNTARRQHLITGSYFWIGSQHEIGGMRPNFYEPYNVSVDYEVRINTVLKWFAEQNINLGMLYFERPDIDGHSYGILSEKFRSAIKDVDSTLGYLLYKIDELNLKDSLNIIVLGDHGMVNIQQRIVLENYVNLSDIRDYEGHSWTVANLFPKAGQEDNLYDALHGAHPNLTVYRKADIPDRLHYKHSDNIAPIVAVTDQGYVMVKRNNSRPPHIGYHGYDNSLTDMQAFFAAQGPAFKSQFSVETFKNVDIYPLACKILDITPSPNNGTLATISNLLLRP